MCIRGSLFNNHQHHSKEVFSQCTTGNYGEPFLRTDVTPIRIEFEMMKVVDRIVIDGDHQGCSFVWGLKMIDYFNLIVSLCVSNPRIQADLRFSYQTIRSLIHTWHGDSRLAEVHADSYNSNHEVKWMFDNSLDTHWHPRQHNPTRLVEIDLKVSRSRYF